MPISILEDARLFLVHSLQGKKNGFESRHPWRRGWEFAVLHSLRVESYVIKILAREGTTLSEHEVILLRLAAILHDICRVDRREDHAKLGAEVAGKWMQGYSGYPLQSSDIESVVEMIAEHSNKLGHEQDFSKAVLKDADTLDEIGAMSIFMTSNWMETHSPFFFYDLRQRLVEFEIPFCDKQLAILHTRGAKEILEEKKAFLEGFIAQLTDELESDAYIEHMLFEISKSGS